MKRSLLFSPLALSGLLILGACNKENPTVSNTSPENVITNPTADTGTPPEFSGSTASQAGNINDSRNPSSGQTQISERDQTQRNVRSTVNKKATSDGKKGAEEIPNNASPTQNEP